MPARTKAIEAGIFGETELDLLSRVLEESAIADETGEEREQRASRIIGYFQAGITDEDELVTLARRPLGR
ncbi:MAG: hypothetical protein WDZ83_09735 [Rhizobiaceae bacterium]